MAEHNQSIREVLEAHKEEIEAGTVRVFALDECHAKGGDICGYGWGDRQDRREVEVANYRDSQTYFGALDCVSGEVILQRHETANSKTTIEFIEHLSRESKGARIILVWDGASYHRSKEFKEYLSRINQGKEWKIHCQRFAPYAPEENPIENIWGQAKQVLRKMHRTCRSFSLTKMLFELFIECRLFTMPNLRKYDAFSGII